MSKGHPLPTLEQWLLARAVLCGDRIKARLISDKSAATAAGVSLRTMKSWVARSRERRPEDAPFVHEIAQVWDGRHELQLDVLLDELVKMVWNSAEETVFDGDGNLVSHKTIYPTPAQVTALIKISRMHIARAECAESDNGAPKFETPDDVLEHYEAFCRKRIQEREQVARGSEAAVSPELSDDNENATASSRSMP